MDSKMNSKMDSKKNKSKKNKSTKSSTPQFENKELCVIGGGAAGAYTAYEAQKRGYETVLIEPQADLGGNCEIVEIPSTIDPSVTYSVNAAVIIFSPTETVTSFFAEFGATSMPFDSTSSTAFVFGPGNGVVLTFPLGAVIDPALLPVALGYYAQLMASPPYLGTIDPPYSLPNFENLSDEQSQLLLEPIGAVLERHPVLFTLFVIIASLLQGHGRVDEIPVWEALLIANPTNVANILQGGYLMLPNGCQEIYDELKDRMLAKDPESILLNTKVNSIVRKNGKVLLNTDTDKQYRCGDAVIAFRPDGLDGSTLKDISKTEERFFGDLTYSGYVPTIIRMELGPGLSFLPGMDINSNLVFSPIDPTFDAGIVSIVKDRPEADYPFRVNYQPLEPADTPKKLKAVEEAIRIELTLMGFENIEFLFIKNHKYQVKPNSEKFLKEWVPFFEAQNNDEDGLYWTGAVASGELSERVWEYSRRLLDENFPDKS